MEEIKSEKYVMLENRKVAVIIVQKGHLNNERDLMAAPIDLLRQV
jgi:hypothetical protein